VFIGLVASGGRLYDKVCSLFLTKRAWWECFNQDESDLSHGSATPMRQVFDLPLRTINMTVYDLGRSQTLSTKQGSHRQVQDLPRISLAAPLDQW
jgi:hypothetical protein